MNGRSRLTVTQPGWEGASFDVKRCTSLRSFPGKLFSWATPARPPLRPSLCLLLLLHACHSIRTYQGCCLWISWNGLEHAHWWVCRRHEPAPTSTRRPRWTLDAWPAYKRTRTRRTRQAMSSLCTRCQQNAATRNVQYLDGNAFSQSPALRVLGFWRARPLNRRPIHCSRANAVALLDRRLGTDVLGRIAGESADNQIPINHISRSLRPSCQTWESHIWTGWSRHASHAARFTVCFSLQKRSPSLDQPRLLLYPCEVSALWESIRVQPDVARRAKTLFASAVTPCWAEACYTQIYASEHARRARYPSARP